MKKRIQKITPRFFRKISHKKGLPPGALVHVGEAKVEEVKLWLISFDEQSFSEKEVSFSDLSEGNQNISWVNINGLHDTSAIKEIGNVYDLHPLVLEDIVNTAHRPKIEFFENYIYLVIKMLSYEPERGLISEQVSFVCGSNYVLSFQEREGDVFEGIRERLRKGTTKIRSKGADYLFYALVDAVVDHYFAVLEGLGERLEQLEEDVDFRPDEKVGNLLYDLRRNVLFVRKSILPVRELLGHLEREESKLVSGDLKPYWRDIYDHVIQITDGVEALRELTSSIREMLMTQLSNRMNNVMKVLTIIATIFIPITFLAGVYGMNFKHMPELEWTYGYLVIWIVFVGMTLGLILFFRKKKWL